ncbi:hypothetical protein MPER_15150, partial [Moniliophthora perniciosa FA553]
MELEWECRVRWHKRTHNGFPTSLGIGRKMSLHEDKRICIPAPFQPNHSPAALTHAHDVDRRASISGEPVYPDITGIACIQWEGTTCRKE